MYQQYQHHLIDSNRINNSIINPNDQIIRNNFYQSFSVSPLQIPQSYQSPSRQTKSPVFYSPISPALTPDSFNTRLSQFQTNKPIETDSISRSDLNILSLDFITPTSTPNLEQKSDTVIKIENVVEQIDSNVVDITTNVDNSLNEQLENLTETVPILQEVSLNIESSDASEIESINQNKENHQDEISPEQISPILDDVNTEHTTLEPITLNQIESIQSCDLNNSQINKEKETEVVPETVLAPIAEKVQLHSQAINEPETSNKSKSTDLQTKKRKIASKFESNSKRKNIPINDFLNNSDLFTKDEEEFDEDYFLKMYDIKTCIIRLPIGTIPPMTQKD